MCLDGKIGFFIGCFRCNFVVLAGIAVPVGLDNYYIVHAALDCYLMIGYRFDNAADIHHVD